MCRQSRESCEGRELHQSICCTHLRQRHQRRERSNDSGHPNRRDLGAAHVQGEENQAEHDLCSGVAVSSNLQTPRSLPGACR